MNDAWRQPPSFTRPTVSSSPSHASLRVRAHACVRVCVRVRARVRVCVCVCVCVRKAVWARALEAQTYCMLQVSPPRALAIQHMYGCSPPPPECVGQVPLVQRQQAPGVRHHCGVGSAQALRVFVCVCVRA